MKVAHNTYSNQNQFDLSLNFFVFAFTLDQLRLNCIGIFHYLANQPKGTPIFENEHRKSDQNKESGAVFNNFDFQPDEQPSNTHNITVLGAIFNSSMRFDGNDAILLIPQKSVHHAVLEADRHEAVFYNALSFGESGKDRT